MKLYFCPSGISEKTPRFHIDRDHFQRILAEIQKSGTLSRSRSGLDLHVLEEADTIESCDLYAVLSGMYLTFGYKEAIEAQLTEAVRLGKPVLVVRPNGTGYIPLRLRKDTDHFCNLSAADIARALAEL